MNQEWMLHDSHDTYYRNPFGAVALNANITLRLLVNTELSQVNDQPDTVTLRLWHEGCGETLHQMILSRKELSGLCWYEVTFAAPGTPGVLWYYFIIVKDGTTYYYGNNNKEWGGIGGIRDYAPPSYQISVYREQSDTPDWLKNAVIYQIFPDRFYNGNEDGSILNPRPGVLVHTSWHDIPVYTRDMDTGAILAYDFFGGNLPGVIKKLPYLKDLGVNVIYFNPIFESVSNHKYDTGDYKTIDPMFGDNAMFAELCQKAGEMGISVILDGVFSHTGNDSIYFNQYGNYPGIGACQSKDSPYYSWYRFSSYPDTYESWWGIGTMPNVEETEPSYLDYIIEGPDSVVKHWARLGAKGWRLDVADELPTVFLKKLRKTLKEESPDLAIIGEVWEDASRKVAYGELRQYFDGDHLDAVMNYPFRKTLIDFLMGYQDAETTEHILLSLYENYPKENFYANMNVIGTHDVPRILTILGGAPPESEQNKLAVHKYKMTPKTKTLAIARLKLAVLWQMTFPGAPCVYYGDEAGMEGYSDPYNRGPYPWGKENQELLSWYKKVIALRNTYPMLRTGEWLPLIAENDIYGFVRAIRGGQDVFGKLSADNVAFIIINRNVTQTAHININLSQYMSDQEYLIDALNGEKNVFVAPDGQLRLSLLPLEGKILLKSLDKPTKPGERTSGILLHPTSLPGKYGIGDLGDEAYKFADFLRDSGQKLWQVLPMNPPGFGNSPYQCLSAFAGNTLLISPDKLVEAGWLAKDDLEYFVPAFSQIVSEDRVNFSGVKYLKEKLFRKAFNKFKQQSPPPDYEKFISKQAHWLDDYTLFIALRGHFEGRSWNKWPEPIARRETAAIISYKRSLSSEIEYQTFLQYIFWQQLTALKSYVNEKDLKLIGDIPLFVAHDSADVWANQKLFCLDEFGSPTQVAGVPPDYFSSTGQLWGNPLYRWGAMASDDYCWWRRRIATLLNLVDIVRIDHFRGFESYWEIPAGSKTAINGRWVLGPGSKFFETISRYLGDLPLIAEDLGVITPAVNRLKNRFGFAGMKILQFSFGDGYNAPEFPYNCGRNSIAYTGTHDNDTLVGWWKSVVKDGAQLEKLVKNHLRRLKTPDVDKLSDREICERLVELVYTGTANTVILPLQDVLFLDKETRMNQPGTVGDYNWSWRVRAGEFTPEVAQRLENWSRLSGRI